MRQFTPKERAEVESGKYQVYSPETRGFVATTKAIVEERERLGFTTQELDEIYSGKYQVYSPEIKGFVATTKAVVAERERLGFTTQELDEIHSGKYMVYSPEVKALVATTKAMKDERDKLGLSPKQLDEIYKRGLREPELEEPPTKAWADILTGELYTSSERQELISQTPAMRDRLSRTRIGQKQLPTELAELRGEISQKLEILPQRVVEIFASQPTTPLSSLVENPLQKRLLDELDDPVTRMGVSGFTAIVIAGIVGMPSLLFNIVTDPARTGRDLIDSISQAGIRTGAYAIAQTRWGVPITETPEIAFQRGMDAGILFLTVLGLKMGISGVKGIVTRGKAAVKPSALKQWRGVAADKLKSSLKKAGASNKLANRVNTITNDIASAIAKKDPAGIRKAVGELEATLKADTTIDPVVKDMVLEGGKYIKTNAEALSKMPELLDVFMESATKNLYDTAVGAKVIFAEPSLTLWQRGAKTSRAYRLTIDEINSTVRRLTDAKTWGNARVQLSELRDTLNTANKNNPTLSDSLTKVDWFKESTRKSFREETRQPTWQQAAEDAIILNRIQKLIDRMPGLRRDSLHKAMQRTGEARETALKDMWDYFEEVYGKDALEFYLKTGREPPPERGVPRVAVKERIRVKPKVRPKTAEEIEIMMREVRAKPTPRESVFPGIRARPTVREAPSELPLTEAIGLTLAGAGLQVIRAGVPMPLVVPVTVPLPTPVRKPIPVPMPTPIPTPTPVISPIIAPTPAPAPVPSPILAPKPVPTPIPEPVPEPTPLPEPEPVPEPVPEPEPVPTPTPVPIPIPTPIPVPTPKIPPPPPPPPPPPTVQMIKGRPKLPEGSIAWASGEIYQGEGKNRKLQPVWNYIPPPWDMDKPYILSAPPVGAKNAGSINPHITVQMIGEPGAEVPLQISCDKGIVDLRVFEGGKRIEFFGGGLKTDYGKRDPSPTVGLSIPESGMIDSNMYQGINRTRMTKKKPKRKVRRKDDFSDLTSLRGIRW